jgi:hypothetical protein
MKAHKHPIPSHRLLKPDERPDPKPVPPKLSYLWLRSHPGVRFADQPANQPRTAMEAALRRVGL